MAIVGRADENERTEEEYPLDHRANASPSPAGHDRAWNSGPAPERGLPLRVRYSLTPYRMTLVPVLKVLCIWGRVHLKREPSA